MRNIKFQNQKYYHIYNRGVDKRKIFIEKSDYLRFLDSIKEFFKAKPPARGLALKFVCYCLNSNHYHFLLKQKKNKGIENFMHKLGTGYTMYFNRKYSRSGSLFEGTYKAVEVQDNSGLLWLSGYINGNSEIHQIAKAEDYQWSSYAYYLNKRKKDICNKEDVLDHFSSVDEYRDFVNIVISETIAKKEEIKNYVLD